MRNLPVFSDYFIGSFLQSIQPIHYRIITKYTIDCLVPSYQPKSTGISHLLNRTVSAGKKSKPAGLSCIIIKSGAIVFYIRRV